MLYTNIATEIIDYQNKDSFPSKLQIIVENIYRDIDNRVFETNEELLANSKYSNEIVKLIKNRFGLNVVIDTELSKYSFASIIPFVNSDIVLFKEMISFTGKGFFSNLFSGINIYKHIDSIVKEKKELYSKIHNRKGYVDTKHAKVGGYLSDVKHYIAINYFVLKGLGITPKEITAIILHEIGHAFTGLEYHHNLTTFNSTILDVMEDINKNKKDKVIYKFKKVFSKKELEDAGIGDSEEVTDFYSPLVAKYIQKLDSQLLNSKYDQTTFENLADSFAVRFNMGDELVDGLQKLNIAEKKVTTSKVIYSVFYILDFMTWLLILSISGMAGIIVAVSVLSFMFGTMFTSKSNHMTYDFPIDRYNRVKNGIVNNLKDTNLPKDLISELVNQYNFIDSVIVNSNYFKNIYSLIQDVIVPSKRDEAYYIRLQQNIENNMNNSLFVKSAHLKIV